MFARALIASLAVCHFCRNHPFTGPVNGWFRRFPSEPPILAKMGGSGEWVVPVIFAGTTHFFPHI